MIRPGRAKPKTGVQNRYEVISTLCLIHMTDRWGKATERTCIDLEDADDCSELAWYISYTRNDTPYVQAWDGEKKIWLSHFILGPPPEEELVAHHINNNTLDNRKENLIWVTKQYNNHYNRA
jgi:hypothetical protein